MSASCSEPYVLISADTHAGASITTYREYLDPKYRDEFDAWRGGYKNPSKEHLGRKKSKNWDDDERFRDLEADGVVGEIVFPNTVPPFYETGVLVSPLPKPHELERRLAGIRAHNRWLADWCAAHPERRAGIGLVHLNDVDEAIRDVEWIAKHGLRGGILLPNPPPDDKHIEPLYSPSYDRLWAVCQDLGVVLNQHGGTGSPDYGPYPTAPAMWIAEVGFFSKRGFTELILGGVFERFPGLRYILTESGCAWAPAVLAQLDGIHARMKAGTLGELTFDPRAVLREPPSFYARRNCYYGASFPSPMELEGRAAVGVDRILWGNDYPHYEGSFPYTRQALRHAFSSIDASEVRAMLGGNAAKLYGFDLAKLAPIAARCGPTPEDVSRPLPREEIPRDSMSPAFRVE
ncbi:MAG TPA: amidohydrolase family protein [Myxococcota bacterium]|nr:amidohydrolase family protein [Myxococcota bacterium]